MQNKISPGAIAALIVVAVLVILGIGWKVLMAPSGPPPSEARTAAPAPDGMVMPVGPPRSHNRGAQGAGGQ